MAGLNDPITFDPPPPSVKPTKVPSMARSKPSTKTSPSNVVPKDNHIDVLSSGEEPEAGDVSQDEEIVEMPVPPKKVGPPKPRPIGPPPGAASSSKQAPPQPEARKPTSVKSSNKASSDDALHAPRSAVQATRTPATKEERRLQRLVDHLQGELEAQEEQTRKANMIAKQFEKTYDELVRSQNTAPDSAPQARIKELEQQLLLKEKEIVELRNIEQKSRFLISDTGILQFTTKEAMKLDRKAFSEQLQRANKHNKELEDQHRAIIAEKDRQHEELKTELDLTKKELKAEVERAKTLTSKSSGVHSVAGPGISNANAETIALYEDITNILVTNTRLETSPYLKLQDKSFTCLSSVRDGKALNFYLRLFWEPLPEIPEEQRRNITSKDQLLQQCKYIPIDLDKEPDEGFKARLDFLANPFTFAKDQIDVFAKTMLERLSSQNEESMIEESMMAGSELGDEEDSVMEVDPER